MKRVIIESPFAGNVANNREYAEKCCLDAISKNENPFASHLFYTQFLDDNDPMQREKGIDLGMDWWAHADLIVFYIDLGVSSGMNNALMTAVRDNKPYEFRQLFPVNIRGETA